MRLSDLMRYAIALGAAVLAVSLIAAAPAQRSIASAPPDARKQPMRFAWNDCKPDCKGWVSALGIVTEDTPAAFEDFAKGRDLQGATLVLNSSGGSVNDAMTLGRRLRPLKLLTSVGATREAEGGEAASIEDSAYCESMCVFLLLAGETRYVPDAAKVRVHQIWLGDRADNALAASYSAQDVSVVERDVGRLAKYTFEMGGTGELLALALSVPPWEDLHRMTADEMRAGNLVTTTMRPDALQLSHQPAMASRTPKPVQDRFSGEDVKQAEAVEPLAKLSRTAEATGGSAPAVVEK